HTHPLSTPQAGQSKSNLTSRQWTEAEPSAALTTSKITSKIRAVMGRPLTRRHFLRVLGLATSATLLSAACAPTAPPPTVASGGAPRLKLPAYVPFQGPTDLPSTGPGVDPGYFSYTKNLAKSVATAPGNGDTVTAVTQLTQGAPARMDQSS